jgi:hypothetical protein
MSKPAEYIEKIVVDAFKREFDQEENVIRSLPFFATSLGILATAIAFAGPSLCPPALQPFSVAIYAFLALLVVTILIVFWHLLLAVKPKQFQYLMKEHDLIQYAEQLSIFYAADDEGAPTDVEAAIVDDLRDAVTEQFATAAEASREINFARLGARSKALVALVVAILFAFVILGLILTRDTVAPGECHARPEQSSPIAPRAEHDTRPGNRSGTTQASPPANAEGREGGVGVQGDPTGPKAGNADTGK